VEFDLAIDFEAFFHLLKLQIVIVSEVPGGLRGHAERSDPVQGPWLKYDHVTSFLIHDSDGDVVRKAVIRVAEPDAFHAEDVKVEIL